jgi:hypothetical protein
MWLGSSEPRPKLQLTFARARKTSAAKARRRRPAWARLSHQKILFLLLSPERPLVSISLDTSSAFLANPFLKEISKWLDMNF